MQMKKNVKAICDFIMPIVGVDDIYLRLLFVTASSFAFVPASQYMV